MRSLSLRAAVMLVAIILVPASARAVFYAATLMHPAGFTYTAGYGTSGSSYVGYGTGAATNDRAHALLWNGSDNHPIDLHPEGFDASAAAGVSGSIQVGHAVNWGTNRAHALMWRGSAASAVDLTPAGFDWTQAFGAFGEYQVGSGYGAAATGRRTHALLWSGSAASMIDLNPVGFHFSEATAIWGPYQVGYGQGPFADTHAVLWNSTAASAVDLHPTGFISSFARGVSATSQVGEAIPISNVFSYHAILWNGSAASAIDLNPLGFSTSAALGVVGDIQVGRGSSPDFGDVFGYPLSHALLWRGNAASFVDLHPYLSSIGSFYGSEAFAVGEDGTIVGRAFNWQDEFAVVWTPVIESGVFGDYNNNGSVDVADYVVWRKYNGKNYQLANEVAGTTSGQVTGEDFDAWRAHFGSSAGNGTVSAGPIPETCTATLSLTSIAFALLAARLVPRSRYRV